RFAVAEASAEHPMPVLGAVGASFRRRLGIVALIGFAVSVITGPANTFIFLYAENVVHLSGGVTAAMVVASGVAGLGGLLVGRWLADHVGRRPAAALGMVGVAVCGVLAYSGSAGALVLGYILGVVAGAVLAPALGALVNELFPTSIRASVAGWFVAAGVLGAVVGLLAFGAVADIDNRWVLAGIVVFLPAATASGLFFLLPETRGREPEQLWPVPPTVPTAPP
ncbi:MAG TPA: MFS transporter, partial [Acidimicrobiales bacterium]|nr:MFS transporter [Acidimicrobiales bacterium]